MFEVARRPRWIAALVLALAVAAGFAALGQWQLERSFDHATVIERETETPIPLEQATEPSSPVATEVAGQLVEAEGVLVPGDFVVLSGRYNGGESGFWVTGHVEIDDGPSLAIALGWAESLEQADAAIERLDSGETEFAVSGRYLPSEAPQDGEFETELTAMSVGALINVWSDAPGPVYSGYVVSSDAPSGLDPIDSPEPTEEVSLNWLNLFYAAEWVIFGGFAVFLWWRLVKDEWEREQESATAEATVE